MRESARPLPPPGLSSAREPLDSLHKPAQPALSVYLARDDADVEEAQRLRYQVFAVEMGAKIGGAASGIDRDEFDPYCEHLLVRDDDAGVIVGTYRILAPRRQRDIGRLYADAEFDLAPLAHLRPALIEVGRSCVHPDYRDGSAILLLWAGMAQYMRSGGYRHLIGCASAALTDDGRQAASLRDRLQAHLVEPALRVAPRLAFPHERIARSATFEMPPLIKGYVRLGAKICGEPAWDPDFNSADFLVWLSLDNMPPRYARHFDLLASQAGGRAIAAGP